MIPTSQKYPMTAYYKEDAYATLYRMTNLWSTKLILSSEMQVRNPFQHYASVNCQQLILISIVYLCSYLLNNKYADHFFIFWQINQHIHEKPIHLTSIFTCRFPFIYTEVIHFTVESLIIWCSRNVSCFFCSCSLAYGI